MDNRIILRNEPTNRTFALANGDDDDALYELLTDNTWREVPPVPVKLPHQYTCQDNNRKLIDISAIDQVLSYPDTTNATGDNYPVQLTIQTKDGHKHSMHYGQASLSDTLTINTAQQYRETDKRNIEELLNLFKTKNE
jgi:hypothetical protein